MRLAILGLLALAACSGASPPQKGTAMQNEMICGAQGLAHLVGQPADSFDFGTLDVDVRILPPGSMMTMDHRPDRLNVDLDDAGVITRLWCG